MNVGILVTETLAPETLSPRMMGHVGPDEHFPVI